MYNYKLRPGVETHVSIKREFFNKLEEPYSDCLNDLHNPPNEYAQTLFGYFENMNVTEYDFDLCSLLCFQDKLIKQCGCSDISTPKLNNESYCLSIAELNCMQTFSTYFKSVKTFRFCDQACPEKCNSFKYILKATSRAGFKNINYIKKLQSFNKTRKFFPGLEPGNFRMYLGDAYENISDGALLNYVNQGYVKFSVNYDSLYYSLINEGEKVSSDEVFNLFGQQIGFYLDASLLTLPELPIFIIMIIIDVLWYVKRLIKSYVLQNFCTY